ncbi:MAG: rhamnogalacturonan endolyase [Candidatus Pelagisphaera sp.]|jgi:rhamnogalacturonan endolyase
MHSLLSRSLLLVLLAIPQHSWSFEKLDRGMIAIPTEDNAVYLGWRLLQGDPAGLVFNLYRSADGEKAVKLNDQPIREGTNFVDTTANLDKANTYWIKSVSLPRGFPPREIEELARVELKAHSTAKPYLSLPLQGDYGFQRVGIADLNGDGKFDYVIKQPERGLDPGSARPSPDTYKIEAYLHDGTFLWKKDLGWNMNMGIWWTPMIVYDFDGDGKAEVALKTAPYADSYEASLAEKDGPAKGFVISGPEQCSILDGMTGKQITQVDWVERGDPKAWGDDRGNRVNRNQIGIASLDGEHASLLVCRGTYTRMVVDAYDLIDGKLVKRWRWDGDESNPPIRGQGSHGMHAADLDGDGKQEIILGSVALDDDGTTLWNVNMGHNDVGYLADVIPARPGLEIALGYETRQAKNGICLVDARTGEIIWGHPYKTTHIHDQGMFGDFVPDNPGMEFYSAEQDRTGYWLYDAATGELISDENIGGLSPHAVYWSEKTTKAFIPEISYRDRTGTHTNQILEYGGAQIGSIQGTIVAIADVVGDWREELIVSYKGELRIYTTTIPTTRRRVCLMEDPLYRNDAAQQSMGYFYPPQLSYHFR